MKKYFIVADVHGFYNELQKALDEKGWDINNPDHIFVSCGDLLDRGPDAVKCLEFVNNLTNDRKILICGNHEDLLEDAIIRGYFKQHDIHNRTNDTCYQIVNYLTKTSSCESFMNDEEILNSVKNSTLWKSYADCLLDYFEIGDNIFVHGWIPCNISFNYEKEKSWKSYSYFPDWREASVGSWMDARWLNGMEAWSKGVREEGKTIWCGHWHCSWGNAYLHNDGVEFLKQVETMYIDPVTGKMEPHANYNPFKDDGIVALDACTAWSKVVNCEVLDVD